MTSCDEIRAELVAALRGETSPSVAVAVSAHLRSCDACAAEGESLRRTMDLVGAHVRPELSADARMRLASTLDVEFARQARRRHARRWATMLALPTALAAGVVAAVWTSPPASVRESSSAPAVAAASRDPLEAQAADAATRGLAWLASRQRPDGTWAPTDAAAPETTAATTASALLAFAADGQTARRGARRDDLRRAENRLAGLVAKGFDGDEDKKPVYAMALAVRALAKTYRLDRDLLTPQERSDARESLGAAGRRLVQWQCDDGGFGYVPRARRSDSSCTLFAVAALVELKDADVLDASSALSRASGYLTSLRTADGGVAYSSVEHDAAPSPTAALLALDGHFGRASSSPAKALRGIEESLAAGGDALLAWTGAEALARHGRSLEKPVRALLAGQRADGAWPAAGDSRCASAGDAVTTAFGVLALAPSYDR